MWFGLLVMQSIRTYILKNKHSTARRLDTSSTFIGISHITKLDQEAKKLYTKKVKFVLSLPML